MVRFKKILSIFMAGVVLIAGIILPQKNAATAAEGKDYGISNPRVEKGVTTWDKIKFGSYYQDDVKVRDAEPIKWRVLSIDGDDAFLLADNNLDAKPYNEEWKAATWETCTLRKWLNEDFYNEAFNAEEQKAIRETMVINDDNTGEDTNGGSDTTDKVYLLSIEELCSAEYGFCALFNENSDTRRAKNTYFAKVNGASDKSHGYGEWWLRSSGVANDIAAYVDCYGCGMNDDEECNVGISYAVRPVLHINLSVSKVETAGKIDSGGNITASGDEIANPVVEDGVTTWDCVYFGSYRQSGEFNKQALEWRVLSVDGDNAFLLADKNLDCKPYDEDFDGLTWETCTLRKWLNDDFYNEAFDDGEKEAILDTTVVNDDNLLYDTDGGNNTTDKVYLLSASEAADCVYGFETVFSTQSKTRQAKNTYYAKVNGVSEYSAYDDASGCGGWWLRSPGNHSGIFSASCVDSDGKGEDEGDAMIADYIAVRPVLHVNLSSSAWSKAGEVTAVRMSDAPTMHPDVTEKPMPTPTPAPMQNMSPEPAPSNMPSGNGTTVDIPAAGTIFGDNLASGIYMITKPGENVNGSVVGAEVEYVSMLFGADSVIILNEITMNGITYKVTSIADNAFRNDFALTEIKIGDNVRMIGKNAFAGCDRLTSVLIGKNVTTIRSKAFYKCTKLKKITVRTTKLKNASVGAKIFAKTNKKITVKVPKKKFASYRTLFRKKGVYKKAKYQKI